MDISVFGLGYVGTVTAGCLAEDGHTVVGVDPVATKVELINSGKSPIIEADIAVLVTEAVAANRLWATADPAEAIRASDLSFVCVGTPSKGNGDLELEYVRRVCASIGKELARKDDWHTVVIRSTILPGTMRGTVIPTLEQASGKTAGADFGICNNPEFLREGSAVHDFRHPPKTVIGESDKKSGDLLASLYAEVEGVPLIRTDMDTAEMVKYVDNAWHALKVGFANEVGNLSKSLGLDGHAVMDIFCQDRKLNISPSYLKPGFAFGGSCLPKDLRALSYKARSLDLAVPIIDAVLPSNELQVRRAVELVRAKGGRKVGVLGFSFKAGTDDLRESPVVALVETLLGKGHDIRLYDRNVNLASLVGANRRYILEQIPHISNLMVGSMEELLDHADTVVVGHGDPEFADVLDRLNPGQTVVDLVRIADERTEPVRYEGICW